MKTIKVENVSYKLDFTFNSFMYLEDFDVSRLNNLQKKPFAFFRLISDLFYGAINCHVDKHFTREESDLILQKYLEKHDAMELAETLISLLELSCFFKKLQSEEKPQ